MARNYNGGTDKTHWVIPGAPAAIGCVSFWMRSTQTTTNVSLLNYSNSTSKTGWIFLFNSTANKISAYAKNSGGSDALLIASTTSVNSGSDFHVALNYNRNSGQPNELFINGTQEGSANSSSAWTTASTGFFIQASDPVDTFWASYVGDIWEVAHYTNGKLDASEIAALAKGFSPKLIRPSGLTFYAPMVRDSKDIRSAVSINSETGGSIVPHGRVIGGAV